jgi:DNA-directed RNA polymerase subunit M/transcription elongation factor TFIIS
MEYAKFNSRGHISDNTDICESAEFKASYSPICAEVLSYININSLTCKNYGRHIIDGIIQNKIDPKKIAFQPITQLCPESMRKEKEKIEVRMNQKIELKVSGLFKCPYCKESKSSYKEVQKRALDEPASYVCICLNPDCGRPFTGH